ncbi:MAG: hypothetical protein QW445_07255 [Candidatus Bathyarchaeia archaeon]
MSTKHAILCKLQKAIEEAYGCCFNFTLLCAVTASLILHYSSSIVAIIAALYAFIPGYYIKKYIRIRNNMKSNNIENGSLKNAFVFGALTGISSVITSLNISLLICTYELVFAVPFTAFAFLTAAFYLAKHKLCNEINSEITKESSITTIY